MRAPDPTRSLLRALERAADAAQVAIAFEPLDAAPWVSALFVGTRQRLSAVGPAGTALDLFLAALPELDLPIRAGCVADLAVALGPTEKGWAQAEITALVIED